MEGDDNSIDIDKIPISKRLEKTIEMVSCGKRFVFEDGRKPGYFGLCDLDSKPFWMADECDDDVLDLINDLKENHDALLAEALQFEKKELCEEGEGFRTESNGKWFVRKISADGKMSYPGECPVLEKILKSHPCVCYETLFSAVIVSYLYPGGCIKPHHGPTNARLRLQYPLRKNESCELYCGEESTKYENGYAIIDDSYLHWAKNEDEDDEKGSRIMIVIDLWHPLITREEREAIPKLIELGLK